MSPILNRKMDPCDCCIHILCTKKVCHVCVGPILNRKLDRTKPTGPISDCKMDSPKIYRSNSEL